MSIYSNDNIRKIAKLTTREWPQKSKNPEIIVRENNGLYSNVYGGQNEFVERVTRVFILCMRRLGQNRPLWQKTIFAVARLLFCIGGNSYTPVTLFQNQQESRMKNFEN